MRALIFGTYDTSVHPRIGTIAEGLRERGLDVTECNAPLGLDTAARVQLLAQPWRLPGLVVRLAARWATLAVRSHRGPAPDVVIVGYMGHFDVHLARLLFPRVPVVLDHMVSASGTGRDRGLDGGPRKAVLRTIDAAALRAADIVVVDTDEHLQTLPSRYRARAVVVPVGAPSQWFRAAASAQDPAASAQHAAASAQHAAASAQHAAASAQHAAASAQDPASESTRGGPLKVVFYGLFTPLQGAPVIGEALGLLAADHAAGAGRGAGAGRDRTAEVEVTMVGTGQDYAATRAAAAGNDKVRWLDWVAPADLPELVAGHDVCLGIFGTGDKARRVVPNKVFQGAAAGCAIVTSDTPPQRRALGDAAVFVPPGDAKALASALRELAADPGEFKRRARDIAERNFAPHSVVVPLVERLTSLPGTGRRGRRAARAKR